MLAFGLVIGLFCFWLVTGYATLALLPNRSNIIQNILLAPAIGLAVTIVLVLTFNRIGLPVKTFGLALAIILLLVAIFVLGRKRPIFPWKRYLPFAVVFLLAMFITGRPLLEFGFNWLANGNDDMANYVLAAERFLNYGFSQIPNGNELVAGQDYSLIYWFFYAVEGTRPGSELLIAWVSSLTGLNGPQIFMPLIITLQMVLISAAGALVCQTRRLRLAAFVTCLILSFSALNSLGILYQLIGQADGLGMVAACATVLIRPYYRLPWPKMLQKAGLAGLVLSAQLIFYPEVMPFFMLSLGVYIVLSLIHRRQNWRVLLPYVGIAILVIILCLNTYLPKSLNFLVEQLFQGSSVSTSTNLFPYFLIPSGLANLWGFQNITIFAPEPWLSLSIVAGGLFLLLAIYLVVLHSWRRQPVALMCGSMLLVAAYMFIKHTDFPLFKLAMYIQPFLMGTFALSFTGKLSFKSFSIKRPTFPKKFSLKSFQVKQWVGVVLLVVMMIFSAFTQAIYVEASRGDIKNSFALIPDASSSDILGEFDRIMATNHPQGVLLDNYNTSLLKLQTIYTRGYDTGIFEDQLIRLANYTLTESPFDQEMQAKAEVLRKDIKNSYTVDDFNLLDKNNPSLKNTFTLFEPQGLTNVPLLLVSLTSKQTLFNRWGDQPTSLNFEALSTNEIKNHLIFVQSTLGQNFFGDRSKIAFYQLEKDPFFPGQTMSGVGRYLVFQAVNPDKSARMVLSITASNKGDRGNQIPLATVVGDTREDFPIIGRGSARIFSPIISPQQIGGEPYYGIDMGLDGTSFPGNRTGLMNLYSKDVVLDIRKMVGFGRDISLVSNEQYQNMNAPTQVSKFPTDLENPNLEYSGVYEDGWVSEAAFFGLNSPAAQSALVVRGIIPKISDPDFKTDVTVMIDGKQVATRRFGVGNFEMKMPAPTQPGRHRVDLRFSKLQSLPGGDNRPVAGLLQLVGFVPGVTPALDITDGADGVQLGQGWYALETENNQPFRWVNNEAELLIDAPGSTEQNLSLDIEPGPSLGSQPLQLNVVNQAGQVVATENVKSRQTLSLKLPITPGQPNLFRLQVKSDNKVVANDSRILNFRLFQIKI